VRAPLAALALALLPGFAPTHPPEPAAVIYDVRAYGAKGDGSTLDTDAINRAIAAAAAAGGGTVTFPGGRYPSFSIHLRSAVTLQLEAGATLVAATPTAARGYDPAEPGAGNEYQDFGHSHWHNSLMWGEGLHDVSILGPGTIDGTALWKGLGRDPGQGAGNKAIALKLSRNVTIRDLSILSGGHFAILVTGVDNLTVDNLKIDTNRDGIDIDACRNVRVSNTSVNSPHDDGIVLKSSFALGYARATENVTITNVFMSGYEIGSMLDATYKRTFLKSADQEGPAGRIKFGTESNGGFKNITISNVVMDRTRGLALETVDGGLIEDVTISNVTMRDVQNAPLFLRIGSRMRGPAGTPIGALRRVTISNVVAYDADPRYASIIAGLPGHPVEDVRISGVRILYRGGLTQQDAAAQPESLVNGFFFKGADSGPRDALAVPEKANDYPEPSMFGVLPAYGFYIRHADGIVLEGVEVGFMRDDRRPAFVLDDVADAAFRDVTAQKVAGVPTFVLRNVRDFRTDHARPVADTVIERVDAREF
jgi:polygalacturonase